MKKLNVLFLSLLILLLTSCSGEKAGEKTSDAPEVDKHELLADKFCSCNKGVVEMMAKRKADRASVSDEVYLKTLDEGQACFDPGGKLQEEEAAMSSEERKANAQKMTAFVIEKCPDVAEAFDMK